jgi:hypothetical protein
MRQNKKAQLENGHELYERYLGLILERQLKGPLVFKMHNIDPKNPKRQFSFAIGINDDTEQYAGAAGCLHAFETKDLLHEPILGS